MFHSQFRPSNLSSFYSRSEMMKNLPRMLDAIQIGLPLEFIAEQEKVPLEFILGLKNLPMFWPSTIAPPVNPPLTQ